MTVKLEVTREAQDQVRSLIASQKPGTAVRVFMQAGSGGGCGDGCGCGSAEGGGGGPSFGLAFDRPRNGDEVVPVDGFQVVVDRGSAEFVDGAKIDFVQNLDASGFQIIPAGGKPPEAPIGSGCGCGSGGGGCC